MGVELLTERHKDQIAGILSCYDRIIIQGTVPGGVVLRVGNDRLLLQKPGERASCKNIQ